MSNAKLLWLVAMKLIPAVVLLASIAGLGWTIRVWDLELGYWLSLRLAVWGLMIRRLLRATDWCYRVGMRKAYADQNAKRRADHGPFQAPVRYMCRFTVGAPPEPGQRVRIVEAKNGRS